jgi:hypothetical protein
MKIFDHAKLLLTGFPLWLCLLGCLSGLLSAHAEPSADASIKPGTLAYHLATNAAARAAGRYGGYNDKCVLVAPYSIRMTGYAEAEWSRACWLSGVQGLSATPIGYSNSVSGQGLPTMISPRHYVCATHMHPENLLKAFLGTNNVIHWRKTLQRVDVGGDTSVGILDADLPPAVGFLPVLPANYTNYLPTTFSNIVQGIGMNQDMFLFSQPMTFGMSGFVNWDSSQAVPLGLSTNWNMTLRGGDSSNPDMLLIGNQLVLVSHNSVVRGGPNYASQIPAINQAMHLLSTNNHVVTDYQLKEFALTNWPVIH